MKSIITSVVEQLKEEFTELFRGTPSIEDVEEFSWTRLKQVAVELTEAYAKEIDQVLHNDKAGRRSAGLVVERLGNNRSILTDIGEISYDRTYYALRNGTYSFPVDEVLGVDSYQRLSDRIVLGLAGEAKEGSYAKASRIVTEGNVSRQTVMNALRRCRAREDKEIERRQVPVLHIDADEDHISLQNGRSMAVPLVSIYEGVEKIGEGKRPRRKCINVFHHSALRAGEDFWDDICEKITARYDLKSTRIYLHGDGAAWIKQGLEYLPNSTFVLDCYHRNKAKKILFVGCKKSEAKSEKNAVSNALRYGNADALIAAGNRLIQMHPERQERIEEGLSYLYNNLDAIAIRYQDPEARNGGATEPHVSHVLSSRLSSRPMGWSVQTLEHLVPILVAKSHEIIPKSKQEELSDCLDQAAERAIASLNDKRKNSPFAVDPDRCLTFEVIRNGCVTQLYQTMKGLSR